MTQVKLPLVQNHFVYTTAETFYGLPCAVLHSSEENKSVRYEVNGCESNVGICIGTIVDNQIERSEADVLLFFVDDLNDILSIIFNYDYFTSMSVHSS